jgi:predicted nucleotidyltransferase
VWVIEARYCKHDARKFVLIASPGVDPVLLISERRGDVNSDRRVAVRVHSSSHFLFEPLVGA